MPTRLIRDGILTSEAINSLDCPSEVFFRRLMSVADDFGRFHGSPALLKSYCYPLRSDSVREADISRWCAACAKAGLIVLYPNNGKPVIEIVKFGQQVRAKVSKFPIDNSCAQLITDASNCAQMQTDAHLGVFECVDGDVSEVGDAIAASPRASDKSPPLPATPPPEAKTPNAPTQPPKPATAPASRPPDVIWDALIAGCNLLVSAMPKNERERTNAAVKQLREIGATPDDIRNRCTNHRRKFKLDSLTTISPFAIVTGWSTLGDAGTGGADRGAQVQSGAPQGRAQSGSGGREFVDPDAPKARLL